MDVWMRTPPPKWLSSIGGLYRRPCSAGDRWTRKSAHGFYPGPSGIAQLEVQSSRCASCERDLCAHCIPGATTYKFPSQLIRQWFGNKVMLGSVNAARPFQMAADDLARPSDWELNRQLDSRIGTRGSICRVMDQHPSDAIKEVIEWAPPGAK